MPCSCVLITLLLLSTLGRVVVCPILLSVWCQQAAVPVLTRGWQWLLPPSSHSCACFWGCILLPHGCRITCWLSSSKGDVGAWRGKGLLVLRVAPELASSLLSSLQA